MYNWHLQQLKEENCMLASELKTTKERTSGEGQEAPATREPNGEAKPDQKADQTTLELAEHEKM